MLNLPSHREAWEHKQQWYKKNRFMDRVITSQDGPDGSIDKMLIERIARQRILEA